MAKCLIAMITGIFFMAVVSSTIAREHPTVEHPKEHPKKEVKEHPKEEAKVAVTKEILAQAITDFVARDSEVHGGYFLIYDKEAKKPLVLTLVKVHEDRLSPVGKDTYFACADFKTPEGALYDLDIIMHQRDAFMEVTEITVHKEEGKPRYDWVEKDGVWTRVRR
jgi:hypothetical protein